MIKMVDIVAIAQMDSEKRKETMQKLFGEMLKEDDSKKIAMMKDLITAMNKTDDATYTGLCLTNLEIASQFGDDELKAFVALRMRTNSELPQEIKTRDMKMIQAAMAKVPSSVSQRVSKFM
jgi:hypothetical protein